MKKIYVGNKKYNMSLMEHKVIQHFLTFKKTYSENRLQFKLPKKCKSLTLLELGCGAVPVANHDSIYIGIDIVPQLLGYMKENNPECHLILANAKQLPIRNQVIHDVALNTLLHHLISKTKTQSNKNIDNVFNEIYRITKTNSTIYIRELFIGNKLYSWIMYYLTYLLSEFNIKFPSLGLYDGTIVNFLTEKKLKQLIETNGLITIYRNLEDWMVKKIKLGKKGWYILRKRIFSAAITRTYHTTT